VHSKAQTPNLVYTIVHEQPSVLHPLMCAQVRDLDLDLSALEPEAEPGAS